MNGLNLTIPREPDSEDIKIARKLMDSADLSGVLLNRIIFAPKGESE